MLFDDGLELLDEQQCFELIDGPAVGRVGVSMGALPVILPVNFRLVGRDVLFRTAEGTKLRAALDNAIIAFEVDSYDEHTHTGWSVLLVGRASEITSRADLATADALDLEPWAGDGNRDHWVRLRPEFVSGRRIAAA
jgi:nitroimidazol reductase NimA-like FMN-containing flavoprotein (pyridoxamine 5'-phosphate oxidase superfamily)